MYSSKTTNLNEISASSTKTEKRSIKMATTPTETAQDEGTGFINKLHTIHRPEQTEQTIYRLLCKPIALCLEGLYPPFPALACGAYWASTSGLEAGAAALDACVSWEGVKWSAKALPCWTRVLLKAWGVDCVGVPLALGFGFFSLAGVPSAPHPPYLIPWPRALLHVNSLFLL